MAQPLLRTTWRFLDTLNTELLYDSGIPLLGIYPERNMIQKDTCPPVFIVALISIARMWK